MTRPTPLTPRLISREAAAAYCSISPGTFDKWITDKVVPDGRVIRGRRLWDRHALDRALDALFAEGDAGNASDERWGAPAA